MTIFIKVTDVDGKDFYSHTFDHAKACETGEVMVCPDWNPDPSIECGNGFHVEESLKVALDILGIRPCRVWEVDAPESMGVNGKHRVPALRVLRELTGVAPLQRDGVTLISQGGIAVMEGLCLAWGSAIVRASGSATVEAWGSAIVRAWGSATVRAWGSATVRAWDSATVIEYGGKVTLANYTLAVCVEGVAGMNPWEGYIAAVAEMVATEFAERVDPDEKTYTSSASLKDVRQEIEEVLDAAIADWLLEHTKGEKG